MNKEMEHLAKLFVLYFLVALVGLLIYPSLGGLLGWLGATLGTATAVGIVGVVLNLLGITKAFER